MNFYSNLTFLGPFAALVGALVGGGTSIIAAMYNHRCQDRLQRIASEVSKREAVYADFVMSASNVLLAAYTHDDLALGSDEQRLIGLLSHMRLFAPPAVIAGAERVLRVIVEIALKPSVEFREFARGALSKNPDPEALLAFSSICRADLDHVRRRGE